MSRVYLIANNPRLNPEIFDSISPTKDIVAVCNKNIWEKRLEHCSQQLLLLRYNGTVNNWWHYKKTYNNRYLTTIFIGGKMKNPHFVKFQDNKKLIKIDKQELYDELQYPPKKIFSTGFSAYLILSKLYPDKEIILVGFTFNVWEKHAGLWEKSYFQKHGVKILF